MHSTDAKLSYFLDFLNNETAIWSIRIVIVVAIFLVLGNYYYKHYKYKKQHEESEGGN